MSLPSPWRELHRLHALVTAAEVEATLAAVIEHGWQGVCLPPYWIKKARRDVGQKELHLCAVVGYPLGYQMTSVKAAEVTLALQDGANEVEVALNRSALREGQPMWIKPEVARLAKLAHEAESLLTVVIDVDSLRSNEVALACRLCADAGADFVKHSLATDLTVEVATRQVAALRAELPAAVGIKAIAAVGSTADASELVDVGAERICSDRVF